LKKPEKYEKQINNERSSNRALENDISKSKSNYLCKTQFREKRKQELLNKIKKLKYSEQYFLDNLIKEMRDYKDRLDQEKEKAKEKLDK
jgi:hypothetical protein